MRYIDEQFVKMGLVREKHKKRETKELERIEKRKRQAEGQAHLAALRQQARIERNSDQNRRIRAAQDASKFLQGARVAGGGAGYSMAPYKTPIKTGTCIYCGSPADTMDHVIPVRYLTSVKRKGRRRDIGQLVESCRECNLHLGASLIHTIPGRAAYLISKHKVAMRYSRIRLRHLYVVAYLEKLDGKPA